MRSHQDVTEDDLSLLVAIDNPDLLYECESEKEGSGRSRTNRGVYLSEGFCSPGGLSQPHLHDGIDHVLHNNSETKYLSQD